MRCSADTDASGEPGAQRLIVMTRLTLIGNWLGVWDPKTTSSRRGFRLRWRCRKPAIPRLRWTVRCRLPADSWTWQSGVWSWDVQLCAGLGDGRGEGTVPGFPLGFGDGADRDPGAAIAELEEV